MADSSTIGPLSTALTWLDGKSRSEPSEVEARGEYVSTYTLHRLTFRLRVAVGTQTRRKPTRPNPRRRDATFLAAIPSIRGARARGKANGEAAANTVADGDGDAGSAL